MRRKKKEKSEKEKDKTKISITATDREGEVNGPTWGPSSEDQPRQHVPRGKGPIRETDPRAASHRLPSCPSPDVAVTLCTLHLFLPAM